MEEISSEEAENSLNINISKSIVVVKSKSKIPEVMKIGNTIRKSETFIPKIAYDHKTKITYMDCPGFLDNRGPEINIANAVNIKQTFHHAKSVRVVILINYNSLEADR